MKSSIVALALVLFLSLSFLPNPIFSEPVYDINGDKVVTGAQYYLVSTITGGGGGGVDLFSGRNGLCPRDVGQHQSDLQIGTPVKFLPVDYDSTSDSDVVEASTDLNIVFIRERRICNRQSLVWKVDDYDDKRGAWFITTNGFVGHPGATSLRNWFQLEKPNPRSVFHSYKIVHCPSVCNSCVKLCADIGLNHDSISSRLALSKTAKQFSLVKVEEVEKYMGKINAII